MINKVSFKVQVERTDFAWEDKNLNIRSYDEAWPILYELEEANPTVLHRIVKVTEEIVYA